MGRKPALGVALGLLAPAGAACHPPQGTTTALELLPSTTVDAIGIQLGGTGGGESKYSVNGANVSNPAFGRLPPVVAPETEEALNHSIVEIGDTVWRDRAIVRLAGIDRVEGAQRHALRELIDERRLALESCYVQQVGDPGRMELRIRLALDANGGLAEPPFADVAAPPSSRRTASCVYAVLGSMDWSHLDLDVEEVSFTLKFWMR